MGLGIITLFFLFSFSLHAISHGLTDKPEWLARFAAKIDSNLEMLSFWGMIYAIVSVALLPFAVRGGGLALLAFLSNAALFLLVLPYTLPAIQQKYGAQLPPAVMTALQDASRAVTERKKAAGMLGAGLAFLLFLVLFR
jgi:hypothetical protein